MADDQRGNFGNTEEHQKAGSMSSGNPNPQNNLSDEDRSKGGKASHEKGAAHEFDSDEARDVGEKGGTH